MENIDSNLIIALIVLVAMSAFFSSTETAFSSVNRIKIKNMAADGNKKAKQVLMLSEKYDELLTTILVGNNLVNIMATAIATVLFTQIFMGDADKGAAVSTIVMTIIVLVFGEVTPKSLAKESPEKFCLAVSGIINGLRLVLMPINYLFSQWKKLLSYVFKIKNEDVFSQDELITIVEEAQNDGDLQEHESDLICAAIEFNDLEVKEILTPRVDVLAVSIDSDLKLIEEFFRFNSFSRLPIYQKSIDNIIGVLHEKDFYYAYYNNMHDIKSILKSIQFTSSHVKISTLLRQLQSTKTHMAVVLDEFGGTAGIITMEDILEELVGEIYDEHDEIKEYVKKIEDENYLIEGDCDLTDMFELFDMNDEEDKFDVVTVSGWVIQNLERMPIAGDTFMYDHLFVTIVSCDERKVNTIKIKKLLEKQD